MMSVECSLSKAYRVPRESTQPSSNALVKCFLGAESARVAGKLLVAM
jgi:hypothetical protein